MTASPVQEVLQEQPNSQSMASEFVNSPTGRSLLHDFEQVNDKERQSESLVRSMNTLKIDINASSEEKAPGISPTCVMEAASATPKKTKAAYPQIQTPINVPTTPSAVEEPEKNAPLVLAAQKHQSDFSNSPTVLPNFVLHPTLSQKLAQPQLNRTSFYGGVIHDMNKEATEMASNDSSDFERKLTSKMALIDEEVWLLGVIAARSEEETCGVAKKCPASFAEAIGEVESGPYYSSANPLNSLNSSRTQLWKPSRSWWEARSGKNPWIEPRSHNKRWRYLWPLIHYHKFLARCIKKLKRNGLDVSSYHSPVCVFLRTEVCAISDHLAEVSKFTAEEWLSSLSYFNGWTDSSPEYENTLRKLVSKLKLRSLTEPNDVDSPLLRGQIDTQFLRAMAANREQMQSGSQYSLNRTQNSLVPIPEGNPSDQRGSYVGKKSHLFNHHNKLFNPQAPHGMETNNFPSSIPSAQYFPPHVMNWSNNARSHYKSKSGGSTRRRFHNNFPYNNNSQHMDMHNFPRPMLNHAFNHNNNFDRSGMYQVPPMSGDVNNSTQYYHQNQHVNLHGSLPHYQPHQYSHHQANGYQNQQPPFMNDTLNMNGNLYPPSQSMPWNTVDNSFVPYNNLSMDCPTLSFSHPQPSPGAMASHELNYHQQSVALAMQYLSSPMGMHQPSPSPSAQAPNTSTQSLSSPHWAHLDQAALISSPAQHSPCSKMNGEVSPNTKESAKEEKSNKDEKSSDNVLNDMSVVNRPPENNTSHNGLFINPSAHYYPPVHGRGNVPSSPASQFMMSQTPQSSGYYNNSVNMASHRGNFTSFPFESSPTGNEVIETSKNTPKTNSNMSDSNKAENGVLASQGSGKTVVDQSDKIEVKSNEQ